MRLIFAMFTALALSQTAAADPDPPPPAGMIEGPTYTETLGKVGAMQGVYEGYFTIPGMGSGLCRDDVVYVNTHVPLPSAGAYGTSLMWVVAMNASATNRVVKVRTIKEATGPNSDICQAFIVELQEVP